MKREQIAFLRILPRKLQSEATSIRRFLLTAGGESLSTFARRLRQTPLSRKTKRRTSLRSFRGTISESKNRKFFAFRQDTSLFRRSNNVTSKKSAGDKETLPLGNHCNPLFLFDAVLLPIQKVLESTHGPHEL